MRHFVKEYNFRIDEINKYFVFLKGIDLIETHRRSKLTSPSGDFIDVDRSLQKILRAYTFLLLYNLIESTLSNGIEEIFDNVHDERLSFNCMSDELQKLWVTNKGKRLSNSTNESHIQKMLKDIIKECSDLNEISFEKHRISISGNLDFKSIEKIRSKYGFAASIPNSNRKRLIGFLNFIKTKRNYLAHGNESFSKSAELKTYSELLVIKDEVILYLDSIVNSIDDLITTKKFKKSEMLVGM